MIARLTDRPKPLAEMKPDVPWPAEVQSVMDKVLERDVSARYQSSSEFGRELFKAVSAMRGSGATKAVTAVVATPAAAGVPPAPPRAAGTRPVPATRLNPATPAQATKAVPTAPKNKMPMMIVVGVIAIALASGGAAFVLRGKGTDTKAPAQQGKTAQNLSQSPATVLPVVNLSRELEGISPTDDTPELARQALSQLARFDSVARVAPDSTLLQYRFLRGRAMLTSGSTKAGCDSLESIEGKLKNSKSRFFRADSSLIANVCGK